jgi:5-deoxy-glucuronate isomerase
MQGVCSDMLMDIEVRKLSPGSSLELEFPEKELVILLLTGKVELKWDGGQATASRADLFSELPWVLHVARGQRAQVTAIEDSEILLQSTTNPRSFPSKLYRPEDNRTVVSCAGKWEDTAVRDVITTIDYTNAPYSNLVIGEVVQRQGRWAGYIPHHHPQPEVYYFRVDKPQGFGASFIGDSVFKITDGSFAAIPGGLMHPQVGAPGYRIYFCWMIRHLDGNPWTDRIDLEEHKWLLDAKF